MNFGLDQMPAWTVRSIWTLATLGTAWTLGYVVNAAFIGRLARLAHRSKGTWDDIIVAELKRRVPLWSLLIGAYIALGYWTLPLELRTVATRALFVCGAASVTLFSAAIVSRVVAAYGASITPTVPVTSLTQNVAWILVAVIGLLVVLNGLGVSITPMLTALGVGGLAVALALQEPLANLFAGLFVTLAGQVRIGDYIKLDSGEEGYIVDFSWRSTRIRMLANNLILVPNSKLAQSIVINYHLPSQDLAVLVDVGVDYASDLAHVERVTIEVAKEVMREVNGGVPEFEPFTRYHTFGDSSINFSVILRGKEFVDQYLVKHEFVKRLHARYNKEGINIPFPIRTLVAREPLPLVASER
jgi:small-conductance mechanosensitive channel